jgi:hypothetical protein
VEVLPIGISLVIKKNKNSKDIDLVQKRKGLPIGIS